MKCRPSCGDSPSRWRVLSVDGRPGKHAVSFQCDGCGRHRLQLADVNDLEAAVVHVAHRYLDEHDVHTSRLADGRGRSFWFVDRDDFIASLTAEAWGLWVRWQPDKGVPFSAYLFRFLPLRGNEFFRSLLGRSGNKIQPAPSGLRPGDRRDRLGGPLAAESGDPPVDRSADLLRVVGG